MRRMRLATRTFLVIMIDSFHVATSIHLLIDESRSSLKNTNAYSWFKSCVFTKAYVPITS